MPAFFETIKPLYLFGSGLAFLMGLGQITIKNKTSKNYLFFFLLICLSWSQFRIFQEGMIGLPENKSIILPIMTASIVAGISVFLYSTLLNQPGSLRRRQYLHFIIVIPAVMTDIYIASSVFFTKNDLTLMPAVNISHWLGGIVMLFYLGMGVHRFLLLYSFMEMTFASRIFIIITVYAIVSIICGLFGLALKNQSLQYLTALLFAVLTVLIFILPYRFPAFMNQFEEEVKKGRYKRSRLREINITELKKNILELMETDKVFTEERCTLANLASMLEITAHQLSEFMNNHLGIGFSAFINKYRIEEAKKILMENKEKSILEIAYDSGFGNKTSFNEAFLKHTGLTPQQFRKQS